MKRSSALALAAAVGLSGIWATRVSHACDLHAVSDFSLNLTGAKGHSTNAAINNTVSTINADVTSVSFTLTDTYIKSTGVPSHDVGPFAGNPNTPANQNFTFRVPRSPAIQSGTHTATSLGAIGFMVNGVAFFNASDGRSYNNQGIWNSNANVVELASFDAAMGHPQQTGVYHYHQQPLGLRQQLGDDGTHHSPLLGFAFDGFPVYGPYGYANTDGTGGTKRINSSYTLRNLSTRTTKPDGTALPANQYGPAVSANFPLGYYLEDYAYSNGGGDLDQYNGRFAVTPEYPQGTYAYFTTLDSLGKAAYPYIVGPTYYGVLQNDNRTQTVSIPANVTGYTPALSSTWTSSANGTWCIGTNWNGGNAPAGAATTATFATVAQSAVQVTVDTPQRSGTINFSTNQTSYTIGGTSLITLLGTNGVGINVTTGQHAITAPIVMSSNATVNVGSGASLNLANLQPTAASLTKTGAGVLQVGALSASTLTVSAGTVAMTSSGSATAKLKAVSIGNNSALDLSNNDLHITGGTSKSQIETYVRTAYASGDWNGVGITSSAARTGAGHTTLGVMSGQEYLDNNGATNFNGNAVAASDVLVKYTYFGDVDFNGAIDASDYNLIDFGFVNHLTGWANGDADYSGSVDVSDYNLIDYAFTTQSGTVLRAIQYLDGTDRSTRGMNDDLSLVEVTQHFAQFGNEYAAGFLAAVPEPTSLTGVALLGFGLAHRSCRRRWPRSRGAISSIAHGGDFKTLTS